MRPEVVAALRANRPYFNAGVGRPGRLPRPHLRPVGDPSRADGQVARAHPQAGLGGADDPSYSDGREEPDPRLRLRLPDARGGRHVGAHAHQRRRRAASSRPSATSSPTSTTPRSRSATSSSRATSATRRPASTATRRAARCPARSTRTATRRCATTPRRTSPFAAPKRFIYETFINPGNPLPVGTSRGPLIDFFLDMQAELQVAEARYACDSEYEDCLIARPGLLRAHQDADRRRPCAAPQTTHDPIQPLRGRRLLRRLDAVDCAADLTIDNLVETYLEHWIDDIEDGLKNWSDLGLASTKALFDPRSTRARAGPHLPQQARRRELAAAARTARTASARSTCIGYESEDFINDHLISMLGAPDVVGDLNELLRRRLATRSTTCSAPP